MTPEPRQLPRNIVSEEIVGTGILVHGARALAQAAAMCQADDFYHPGWQTVFMAASTTDQAGEPIDPGTIAAAAKALGALMKLEAIGGIAGLHELAQRRVDLRSVASHARVIAEHAARRRLIGAVEATVRLAFEGADLAEIAAAAYSAVREANLQAQEQRLHVAVLANRALAGLEQRHKQEASVTGIETGFQRLDELTSGWQPSNLVILGAGTGVGKSAIAAQMAVAANAPVLIFSLEMFPEELADRLLVQEGRVDGQRFRSATLTTEEWIAVPAAAARIAGRPVYLAASSVIDVEAIRVETMRWLADMGSPKHALVIVDYLQLVELRQVRRHGREPTTREQEVSTIARVLKQLGMETGCSVLALSQLNEDGALRESKAIGMHANLIAILEQEKGAADTSFVLRLKKQRGGPTGRMRLRWTPAHVRFDQHADQQFKRGQ